MPSPGVYTQVIDKSYVNGLQSRFSCGLVGVASRGPLNEAVQVRTLQDFVANFGPAIEGTFMANAVAAITGAGGDGTRVVRVGTSYEDVVVTGSGTAGSYALKTTTGVTNEFAVDDYVRVAQSGKETTVNARIESIASGTLTLISTGAEAVALEDTYTSATLSKSEISGCANSAESFLTAPTYGAVLTAAGTALGTKSAYTFTVSGNAALIAAGDVVKLVQSGRSTTREAQVQSVNTITKVVTLIPVTDTESGRQAVALQDNYTTASIYLMATEGGQTAAQIMASSEGTWANTAGSTVGLRLTVSPGSAPDSKKVFVWLDGALVETVDNLSTDSTSDDYWLTRLADDTYINAEALFGTEPPGNTLNPWNTTSYTAYNVATFRAGANGANVSASDYVGTLNPAADTATGLQIFNDRESFGGLYAVAVPGITGEAVIQQLALVAETLNAEAVCDVPDSINAREAIDWVNGQGAYSTRARLDNFRVAFYWNWVEALDVFTGESIFMPPSVAVLGRMSKNFDQLKPWYATAGEQQGNLPNVTAVRYPRVQEAVKQAIADDSAFNPILFYRGSSIVIWGNRTTQRTASFMQQVSVVNLVNYILKNVAGIARKYVFAPNDDVVLAQLSQEGNAFMSTVVTQRGVESYQWVCNSSNNTAAVRNARKAIIDLAVIPIGALEVIELNLTVNESGATLNAISNGLTG